VSRYKQHGVGNIYADSFYEARLHLLRNIAKHTDEITNKFRYALTAPRSSRAPGGAESSRAGGSSILILSHLRRLVAGLICGWGRIDAKAGGGVICELLVSRGDQEGAQIQANARKVLRNLKAGEIVLPSQLVSPGKVWVASRGLPVDLSRDNAVPELATAPHRKLCMIYGAVDRTDSAILCLFAGRPSGRTLHTGLYRSDEILLFQLVVDLLKREIENRRARECLEMQSEAALKVLDRLDLGVVVVDQRCEPVIVNRRAQDLIARGDGLAVGSDGLRATTEEETSELRKLLGASDGGGQRAPAFLEEMRISRPSGGRSLRVRISPLPLTGSAEGWKQPLVAVLIFDPQQNGVTTDETLQRLYGLTRAEAHLALLLARGTRLVEASKILGIRPETARTHVKRIFSKTDTSGQVELVHLLLSHMAISTDETTR